MNQRRESIPATSSPRAANIDPTEGLSIGEVAESTGISVHTLRQWERRYGHPKSFKRPSGHRRYSSDELSRIKLVAQALRLGHRANQVVPLPMDQILQLIQNHPDGSKDFIVTERWMQCVKTWDEKQLNQFIVKDWETMGPIGFVQQRVGPFLVKLGESWRQKEINVSQEHFFSEFISAFLAKKWRASNESNKGEIFVLASFEGEGHNLGLHMCAVALTAADKQVRFLGTPTPIAQIVSTAQQIGAAGVCVSVSSGFPVDRARMMIQALQRQLPPQCDLILGGNGSPNPPSGTHRFDNLQVLYDWIQYEWKPQQA